MKKAFQKVFSKLHCSFPEFKKIFNEYVIEPESMFAALSANDGEVEDYILVKYNEENSIFTQHTYSCFCLFYP